MHGLLRAGAIAVYLPEKTLRKYCGVSRKKEGSR